MCLLKIYQQNNTYFSNIHTLGIESIKVNITSKNGSPVTEYNVKPFTSNYNYVSSFYNTSNAIFKQKDSVARIHNFEIQSISNKIKTLKQKKNFVDTTTRRRTEYLLEYFRYSYDIPIKEIIKFKKIYLNNELFFKNI